MRTDHESETSMKTSTKDRAPRRGMPIRVISIAAILLVGVAALLLHLYPPGASSGISSNPPPRMYADSALTKLPSTTDARARGAAFATTWEGKHAKRDDAQFAKDLIASMPKPPGAAESRRELVTLHAIRDHHDRAGDAASKWFEVYGKKKIWKLYFKQHKALLPKAEAKRQKQVLGDAITLADSVEATAKDHFRRQPPYQQDPTLGGLNQKQFANAKKYSYPSRHAVLSYAALGVLETIEPHRTAQFEWMGQQVTYSRLYGAGHFPSDIVIGAYVGSAIGAYEVHYGKLDTTDVRF